MTQFSDGYFALDRAEWAASSRDFPAPPLPDLDRLYAVGERPSKREVEEIYWPLARLLRWQMESAGRLRAERAALLGLPDDRPVPYIAAIAGSVAAGKTTTARVLQALLAADLDGPGATTSTVDLVTTDGFLWPNAVLEREGLMRRKGFPESYDIRALLEFVRQVKCGAGEVVAPSYSHLRYDVQPDQQVVVRQPAILLLEGLNVLAPPRPGADGTFGLAVSDFFDVGIYVDAEPADLHDWYVTRFLGLRATAFQDPRSPFQRYAGLSDKEAVGVANDFWSQINEPNLVENIAPTRDRADLILHKGADHRVDGVRLRAR